MQATPTNANGPKNEYEMCYNEYTAHWYVHCSRECSSDVYTTTLSTEIYTNL
jgi:hypothetical protein